MKVSTKRRSGLWIAVFTLVLAILPVTAIGQDRGRWGRGHNFDKKCGKFINCHDARDGRLDRRRGRIILTDDRGLFRRGRHRDRDFNDGGFLRRARHRDRDFDDEDFFRERRVIHPRDRDFENDDRFLRLRRGRHRDGD